MGTEYSSTELDNSRCIVDDDKLIRAVIGKAEIVDLEIAVLDHGVESKRFESRWILDTSINKNLIIEKDWMGPKQEKVKGNPN